MRRHFLTRAALAIWAIVACEFGMADDVEAPADAQHAIAQVKLDEAIELLRAWHASFETLRFEYRWRNSGQLRKRFPEWADTPEKLDGWYHITKCWFTKGAMLRTEELTFENGQLTRRSVTASNGRFSWAAEFVGESEFPRTLATQPGSSLAPSPQNAVPGWLGLGGFYFSPHHSHGDYLQMLDETAVDVHPIRGSRCVKFSLGNVPHVEKWLDLEHDGLERLITIDYGRYLNRWECLEFLKLSNGHWFPKRVEVLSDSSTPDEIYELEVTEAEVNEVYGPNVFEPPRWDNHTRIHDAAMQLGPEAQRRPNAGQSRSMPFAVWAWRSIFQLGLKNLWLIPPLVFAIGWGLFAWKRRGLPNAAGDKQ